MDDRPANRLDRAVSRLELALRDRSSLIRTLRDAVKYYREHGGDEHYALNMVLELEARVVIADGDIVRLAEQLMKEAP